MGRGEQKKGRAKDGKKEERGGKKQSQRKCDFQSVRDSKKTLSDND